MSLKGIDRFDTDHRLLYLRNIFIFSLGLLVIGLAYFQLVRADEYIELASENRLRMIRLRPPRGDIFDSQGVPLAVDASTFEIKGYPMDFRSDEDFTGVSKLFARHGIPISSADIEQTVEKQYVAPYRAVVLATNLTFAQMSDLVTDPEFSAKLFPSPVWKRIYPAGPLVAHVTGYVGEITKDELEEQHDLYYQGGDIVGKTGIEAYYEDQLRGTVGEQVVEVDSRGRRLRDLNYENPKKGHDIHLTLDLAAQRYAQELMKERRGAMVAMNVNDGSVIVMLSSPTFDPNPLTWGISGKEWNALLTDKNRPMMNRVIGGAYPPGSTFKVVTALAALMEHAITPTTTVYCRGAFELGPQRFRCWRRSGHGTENVRTALRDSCDVFFYQTGVWLGIDKLIKWGKILGVGEKTGIDIPGEAKGNIAGREWKRLRLKESWYQGDTVNYSIGQGFLLMTPLQVARIYAAIANGGKLVVPKLNAEKPTEWTDIGIPASTLRIVQQGIRDVVAVGTGHSASRYGVVIAGKTGTSQNSTGKDHASFVGYAPAGPGDKPKYVAVALIEEGGGGSSVAAPEVAKLLAYLVNHDSGGGRKAK